MKPKLCLIVAVLLAASIAAPAEASHPVSKLGSGVRLPQGAIVVAVQDGMVAYRMPGSLPTPTDQRPPKSLIQDRPYSARRLSECLAIDSAYGNFDYSVGFTTCGSATGVKGNLDPGAGSWHVDSPTNSHVNMTLWMETADGASLEVGYWKGPDYGIHNCWYGGRVNTSGGFTAWQMKCGVPSPAGLAVSIKESTTSSESYDFSLSGTVELTEGTTWSSAPLLFSGVEQEAQNLSTSTQTTPKINVSSLRYYSLSSGSWEPWGTHTHCAVHYSTGNTFGQGTFPTSHAAAIGSGAGSYTGCDGNAPTSVRTNW